MGYDQLFKTILESLFEEFLEVFFPDVAGRFDFGTLSFVGREVFANVPEGAVREADVVAKLHTHHGDPEVVLVHLEIQTKSESDFPRRMFQYYSVLRLHYGLPVLPIAVYLRPGPSGRFGEYREGLFGQEFLLFRYRALPLARLPAEEYVGTSPLAAALAALMAASRNRALLRVSMMERVLSSELNEVLKHLLVNVIQTFFELSGEDAEEYRRLVSRKENRAVQEVELTWADRLMEKGRREGREQGVVEGMRRMLLRQLTARFGELSADVTSRIRSLSADSLESILERVLTAHSLDELGLRD